MLGLTSMGTVHTLIGILAVLAGAIAFLQHGRIMPSNRLGQSYIVLTVLTCLTAFGIFQRGSFGDGHILAILTLLVLFAAIMLHKTKLAGRFSLHLEVGLLSFSYFLHFIPAIVETSTRLPLGKPWASGPEDPKLQPVIGLLFLLLIIGLFLQMRMLRKQQKNLPVE